MTKYWLQNIDTQDDTIKGAKKVLQDDKIKCAEKISYRTPQHATNSLLENFYFIPSPTEGMTL
jgi:hypothetical protein